MVNLNEVKSNIEEKVKQTNEKAYFVKPETAKAVQTFVKEKLLENYPHVKEFNSYIDLCFGSGNLSVHILEVLDFFEEDTAKIKEGKTVIFNDKNNFAYFDLKEQIKGIKFTRYDVFTADFLKSISIEAKEETKAKEKPLTLVITFLEKKNDIENAVKAETNLEIRQEKDGSYKYRLKRGNSIKAEVKEHEILLKLIGETVNYSNKRKKNEKENEYLINLFLKKTKEKVSRVYQPQEFDFITANFLIGSSEDETIGQIKLNEFRKVILKLIYREFLSGNGILLFVEKASTDRDFENIRDIFGENAKVITVFDIPEMTKDVNFISPAFEEERICFRYKPQEEFEELENCQRKTQTTLEEDVNLYELYRELTSKLEKLPKNYERIEEEKSKKETKFRLNIEKKGEFPEDIPLNLLLKGVPGTGKSRLIDKILEEFLKLKDYPENVLRINVHSSLTNAELMQGIGITTQDGIIKYMEKEGLVLNHIKKAILNPLQPFVLILEEVQENSLNELIGDLIYLIEEDKRTDLREVFENAKKKGIDLESKDFEDITKFIRFLINNNLIDRKQFIEIPYLIENRTEYRPLIFPKNLYVFCTSNYREDKKILEDNLLRRFEIIELYPRKEAIPKEVAGLREFFEIFNKEILNALKEELHSDRYLIGHGIFINVKDKESFSKAMLKVIAELKDIKELEFSLVENVFKESFEWIKKNLEVGKDFLDFELAEIENLLNCQNYKELIDRFQSIAFKQFIEL